jgi:deoxyribodipyrimidine photolyase-like uncharacterized protein
VIDMVETRFRDHPGLDRPILICLSHANKPYPLCEFHFQSLAEFGEYQDAMWQGAEELNHSRLIFNAERASAKSARSGSDGNRGIRTWMCFSK